MCNSYQGYSNYPTWAVKLWIDNSEGDYNYWNERAAECNTIDELARDLEEEHNSDENNPLSDNTSIYSDMLSWALGLVNWQEIAQEIFETAHEDDTEEDTEEVDNPCKECGHDREEHYMDKDGTCLHSENKDYCPCQKYVAQEGVTE